MTSPQLLTVDQVAARLQVGERTVRRLIARGELGCVRSGARVLRVGDDQLTAFIENHKIHPGHPAPEVDHGDEDGD